MAADDPAAGPAVIGWGMLALGLAGAASAVVAAGADALLLERVTPTGFGLAVALSSALLALVLVWIGGAADRAEPARLLLGLAVVAAGVVGAVDAVVQVAPGVGALLAMVIGKQLSAAVDLTIWVVLAQRLDARTLGRATPRILAAGGLGAVAGAGLVFVVAPRVGPSGLLLGGAALLGVVAAISLRVPGVAGRGRGGGRTGWLENTRAAGRSPLALRLGLVVGLAGAFAALAYVAVSTTAARGHADGGELARVLAVMRGVAVVLALGAQLTVGPWLLGRLGAGVALIAAPIGSLISGLAMVALPGLGSASTMHVQSKVLDTAVQTPAEKIVQALVPRELRGRIAGFLEGVAKRGGALAGALVAMTLAHAPLWLAVATVTLALGWLVAAIVLARALPALAAETTTEGQLDAPAAPSPGLVALLGGPAEARRELDAALLAAVDAMATATAATTAPALVAAAQAAPAARAIVLWRAVGLGAPWPDPASWPAAPGEVTSAVELAHAVAMARWAGAVDHVSELAADALADRDADVADVGLHELAVELRRGTLVGDATWRAVRELERAVRRRRGGPAGRVAALHAMALAVRATPALTSAEQALVRSAIGALARGLVADPAAPAADRAAAVAVVAALLAVGDRGDAEDDAPRLIATALGDRDDDVRRSAERVARELGESIVPALLHVAAWGGRRARDHATRLLADGPVPQAALERLLDRLIARDLADLAATDARRPALVTLGDGAMDRLLRERRDELVQGVLHLLAARQRSAPLASAARRYRLARDRDGRGRALAIAEAAMTGAQRRQVMPRLDDPDAAAAGAVSADAAVAAELASSDALGRALLLDALGAAGRAAHRGHITAAAGRAMAHRGAAPALLARVRAGDAAADDAMPGPIETMRALGAVPLLREASSKQLADIAARARWERRAVGDVLAAGGEPLEAMLIVVEGELADAAARYGAGAIIDELALVDPRPRASELRVVTAAHLLRLERADFDELLDDVAGLAPVVCRALGARLRDR